MISIAKKTREELSKDNSVNNKEQGSGSKIYKGIDRI